MKSVLRFIRSVVLLLLVLLSPPLLYCFSSHFLIAVGPLLSAFGVYKFIVVLVVVLCSRALRHTTAIYRLSRVCVRFSLGRWQIESSLGIRRDWTCIYNTDAKLSTSAARVRSLLP